MRFRLSGHQAPDAQNTRLPFAEAVESGLVRKGSHVSFDLQNVESFYRTQWVFNFNVNTLCLGVPFPSQVTAVRSDGRVPWAVVGLFLGTSGGFC